MKNERLLSILLVLLEGYPCTAAGLAREFGVSLRTVYRDMDSLSAAGVPVLADAGPGGGYALDRAYRFDRGFLSPAELAGLRSLLEGLGGLSPDPALHSALCKVRAFSGRSERPFVRYAISPWGNTDAGKDILATLQKAYGTGSCVALVYRDVQGTLSERVVEPRELIVGPSGCYLHAWCRLRFDFRLFRVSRINRCRLVDEAPDPAAPATPDCWNKLWDNESLEEIVLEVDPAALVLCMDRYPEARKEVVDERTTRLVFEWPVGEYLAGQLAGLPGARVCRPDRLRGMVARIARSVLHAHG